MTTEEKMPDVAIVEEPVPAVAIVEEPMPDLVIAEEPVPAVATAEAKVPAVAIAQEKMRQGLSEAQKLIVSRWALGAVLVGPRLINLTRISVIDFLTLESLDTYRREMRMLSSALQIGAGAAMFVPGRGGFARWSNIGLLAPNLLRSISQVADPRQARELGNSPVLAWIRLPLQAGLIAWIWLATQPEKPRLAKQPTSTTNR